MTKQHQQKLREHTTDAEFDAYLHIHTTLILVDIHDGNISVLASRKLRAFRRQ